MGGRTGAWARVGAGGTFWLPLVTNGNLYGVSGCYEIEALFFLTHETGSMAALIKNRLIKII